MIDTPINLTNCDHEPIHLPSRIQSFGVLISVTPDWIINHASVNVSSMFGKEAADIIGTPLVDLFGREALHDIRGRLQLLNTADYVERIFGLTVAGLEEKLDAAIHLSEQSIILEFERHEASGRKDHVGYVRPMIERVKKAESVEALCQTAARQLKALIGFDRIMTYKFAEDATGEVIAEVHEADMEPFLGLRYPASDIPKQARDIYTRNLLRIISDVSDEGVAIEPVLGPSGAPLDLTMSSTRAVSPIHLEYLKNMGVSASLSISIVVRGKLWGLFACHHNTPKILSYETRTAAELFAQLFAFVLDQKISDAERQDIIQARILHDKIMSQLAEGGNVDENLDMLADSIEVVVPFDGVTSWVDGRFKSRGSTPTEEQLLPLSRFLNTAAVSQVYVTDSISRVHPPAEDYIEQASGMLALPVSRSPRDYLIFFRKELKSTVNWAGNPEKPAELGPNGIRLTPRKSFQAWQEKVHGYCAPWTDTERRAAESLRMTLLEVVLRMTDAAVKERTKSQEKQELLIAELNHRVRNILNLIKGLVSQSSDAKDVSTFTEIIGGRIQALARAHDQITKENWTPASAYALIETEAKAYLGDLASRIVIEGTDALLTPTAFTTLSLVIHEMMTNSAKYGALTDRHGKVEISLKEQGNGALLIDWRERGGPPVQVPTRKGFGTTIIERSIPFELKGSADVHYEVTGVTGQFVIPSSFVHAYLEPSEAVITAEVETQTAKISGTALVVEDNMIIALDAEDIMSDLGASKVYVASSVSGALQHIEKYEIHFALLDVNLGSETSEAIAIALQEKGIPFVFATGYGDRTKLGQTFPEAKVIQKPYSLETVQTVLSEL
jgi:light-regulated signal transduction histidine kinase (bacteriophytochrome)